MDVNRKLATIIAALSWVLLGRAAETDNPAPRTVYVAVASNFAAPLGELTKAFEKKTGAAVKSSSGSTGKLFAQIENGGPFEVFLSADTAHVDLLMNENLAEKESRFTYAIGRLALYAPRFAQVSEDTLKEESVRHLAIANPETAPYGAAAVETLRGLGLWESFKDRVVYGENIAQTLQFVESGAAEAGFAAYAQVVKRDAKSYWLVPDDRHAPIRQDACLLVAGKGNAAARAFLDFLKSDEGVKIIESFGYSVEKPKAIAK